MKKNMGFIGLPLLFLTFLSTTQWGLAAAQEYEIVDLGTLKQQGNYSRADDINNQGQVVGWSTLSSGGIQPFLWTETGGMEEVPVGPQAIDYSPMAINDEGVVAGSAVLPGGEVYHAFLWKSQEGEDARVDLGALIGEGYWSLAQDINNQGVVVGQAQDDDWEKAPVIWTPEDDGWGHEALETSGWARAINDEGVFVGSLVYGSTFTAALWSNEGVPDPGFNLEAFSEALGINDQGQVVGYRSPGIDPSPSNAIGFLWENGTTEYMSPDSLGYLNSKAFDINNLGQVVGFVSDGLDPNEGHAFLWTQDGGMVDLNDVVPQGSDWVLQAAYAINDLGQIVGQMSIDSETHAFLLTPAAQQMDISPDRGTVGTMLTIKGSGFGDKGGRVFIGPQPCRVLAWSDSSIACVLKYLRCGLTAGVYPVTLKPRSLDPIVVEEAFTIETPGIAKVSQGRRRSAKSGAVEGWYFGKSRWKASGRVYLGDHPCRVLVWKMDPKTGNSRVVFVVPGWMPSGSYDVTVENKVGSDTLSDAVNIWRCKRPIHKRRCRVH